MPTNEISWCIFPYPSLFVVGEDIKTMTKEILEKLFAEKTQRIKMLQEEINKEQVEIFKIQGKFELLTELEKSQKETKPEVKTKK